MNVSITTGMDEAFAVVVRPTDGFITAAGYATVAGNVQFAAARFNADGTFDPTFSADGKAYVDFTGEIDYAQALAVQGDKLILGGRTLYSEPCCGSTTTSNYDFLLARLNADGSLDDDGPSDATPGDKFGPNGKVYTDFGSYSGQGIYDSDYSLVIEPASKKIVAAGDTYDSVYGGRNFAIARYLPDGALDTSFAGTGTLATDFRNGTDDTAYAVALQDVAGATKILAAGYSRGPSTTETRKDFALMRYNDNGTLDTTFGTGGKVWSDFGGIDPEDEIRALAIDPEGKIIAAGHADKRFAVARYLPDNKATVVTPINPLTSTVGEVYVTTVGTARIDLRWEGHDLSNATYNVYRGTTSGFQPTLGNRIRSGETNNFFSDTTVAPSTRYYYMVAAVTAGGESYESDVGSQATGFNVQPTALAARAVDEYTVELTWSDVSSNETGFIVERLANGVWTIVETLEPDSMGTVVTDLAPDTDHSFRVTATFPGVQLAAPVSGPTVTRRTDWEGRRRGLVVGINGHKHGWDASRFDAGVKDILLKLDAQGFRVLMGVEYIFAGPNVKHDGKGRLFNTVVRRLQRGDIANVAVFGYSHGADIARKFVNRLGDLNLPVGTVTYTAYIDAIQRKSNDLWYPAYAERLRPYYGDFCCLWHDNFYQFDDWILRGNTVPQADYNERIFNVSHLSIDEDANVKSQIIQQINNRVII